MTFQKFGGLILLLIGLGIIFGSLYYSYYIFTGKNEPPKIFSSFAFSEKEKPALPKTQKIDSKNPESIEKIFGDQIEKIIEQQLTGTLINVFMPKLFDLITWSIFVGLLNISGSQIAGLGIKLLGTRN